MKFRADIQLGVNWLRPGKRNIRKLRINKRKVGIYFEEDNKT